MKDISIDILAVFGLIIAFLMLFFSWLWANTTNIQIEAIRYENGMTMMLSIVIIAIFAAILIRKH